VDRASEGLELVLLIFAGVQTAFVVLDLTTAGARRARRRDPALRHVGRRPGLIAAVWLVYSRSILSLMAPRPASTRSSAGWRGSWRCPPRRPAPSWALIPLLAATWVVAGFWD